MNSRDVDHAANRTKSLEAFRSATYSDPPPPDSPLLGTLVVIEHTGRAEADGRVAFAAAFTDEGRYRLIRLPYDLRKVASENIFRMDLTLSNLELKPSPHLRALRGCEAQNVRLSC
jgi:hypothetical protein